MQVETEHKYLCAHCGSDTEILSTWIKEEGQYRYQLDLCWNCVLKLEDEHE